MFFLFGVYLNEVKIQYLDPNWTEPAEMMAILMAESGDARNTFLVN